jgi:hypothetical protein
LLDLNKKMANFTVMKKNGITRREVIAGLGVGSITFFGSLFSSSSIKLSAAQPPEKKTEFVFCLNTGTIRGQRLRLDKIVEIASAAGFKQLNRGLAILRNISKAVARSRI